MSFGMIEELLGKDASYLLQHECKTIGKDMLHLPGPDFVDRILKDTDRNPQVLRNFQALSESRPAQRNGLSFHPSSRSRNRTFGRGLL